MPPYSPEDTLLAFMEWLRIPKAAVFFIAYFLIALSWLKFARQTLDTARQSFTSLDFKSLKQSVRDFRISRTQGPLVQFLLRVIIPVCAVTFGAASVCLFTYGFAYLEHGFMAPFVLYDRDPYIRELVHNVIAVACTWMILLTISLKFRLDRTSAVLWILSIITPAILTVFPVLLFGLLWILQTFFVILGLIFVVFSMDWGPFSSFLLNWLYFTSGIILSLSYPFVVFHATGSIMDFFAPPDDVDA